MFLLTLVITNKYINNISTKDKSDDTVITVPKAYCALYNIYVPITIITRINIERPIAIKLLVFSLKESSSSSQVSFGYTESINTPSKHTALIKKKLIK